MKEATILESYCVYRSELLDSQICAHRRTNFNIASFHLGE